MTKMTKPHAAHASLDAASIGAPINRAGISLFPVYLHHRLGGTVRTGPEARLSFEELKSESVPGLQVSNPRRHPGLVVAGELIEGGLQDRSLNVTVLVPAQGTVTVPVSCVEAGRWGHRRDFRHGQGYVPRRVRRVQNLSVAAAMATEGARFSNQRAVWDSVDDELAHHSVRADTSTVTAAREVLDTDTRRAKALAELRRLGPLPGQCGVIVANGRTAVAADVFGAPNLLRDHWDALVGSYLLEHPVAPARASASSALRLLRRFARSAATEAPGVGLGDEVHVNQPRVAGQALVYDGAVVHAFIFNPNGAKH